MKMETEKTMRTKTKSKGVKGRMEEQLRGEERRR